MRQTRETLQQEAAKLTAELAGLEERRRGAEAAIPAHRPAACDLERRVLAIEQQRAAAEAEREQRIRESAELAQREQELTALRAEALAQAEQLRRRRGAAAAAGGDGDGTEARVRPGPVARGSQRPVEPGRRSCGQTWSTWKRSCLTEVNVEAAALRADAEIVRIADETLAVEEETCRTLKQKIEQMGPVNMMALEEYKETAERHSFLETQRTDLMESIENTQETIKEIDQISREKFDEAFARINENFGQVFTQLFHGGQAFLRLTDAENQAESGLEIVASPPGKKLQNVLLLSGGEKALTALSLLVGIFQFQPSPVLRARRSGCGAGRNERRPAGRPAALAEQRDAVPAGDALEAHDACRGHDLRRDDAGAGRVEGGEREHGKGQDGARGAGAAGGRLRIGTGCQGLGTGKTKPRRCSGAFALSVLS